MFIFGGKKYIHGGKLIFVVIRRKARGFHYVHMYSCLTVSSESDGH